MSASVRFNAAGRDHRLAAGDLLGLDASVEHDVCFGDSQMHGHGTLVDSRIGANVQNPPDMISTKLPALQEYQLSLASELARPPRSRVIA